MTNDKKIPNGNQSNNLMSKDTEMVLLGVMLSLVSLIGLLNTGPVGHFLFFIFAYAFGVFCFISVRFRFHFSCLGLSCSKTLSNSSTA